MRIRRSRRGEQALAEANHQQELTVAELQSVNSQLQQTMAEVDRANAELKDQEQRLSEAVADLRESNYVKEETVGLAFTLCSKYISRIDEERIISLHDSCTLFLPCALSWAQMYEGITSPRWGAWQP